MLKMNREDEALLFLQRTPGGLKMVAEDRREAVGNFVDPQLTKAIELLVGKKQIQAKAEPEEEKPSERTNEKAKPDKEAAPETEEKPAEKPE